MASGEHHGTAILWDGQQRIVRDPTSGKDEVNPDAESIDELRANDELWAFNDACQRILDEVRKALMGELDLKPDALVDIPVAFKPVGGEKALAYFPDMVNHLVLGGISVVPKPYGPIVEGKDLFEEAFIAAVPQQKVRFVDDWLPYHEMSGEVHCGTNVRRKPAESIRWWEHRLPGIFDASVAGRG
jgi:protein-arginine deiminase